MSFNIQRVYTKDISFWSARYLPFSSRSGSRKWRWIWFPAQPNWLMTFYEIVLRHCDSDYGRRNHIPVWSSAGRYFTIGGLEGTQLAHCTGAYCPNICSRPCPWVHRKVWSAAAHSLSWTGAPVNFDSALFMNYLQQQEQQRSCAGRFYRKHNDRRSLTVLGAGSYGTALAITLARNGHRVVLWGHDPEHIRQLRADRANQAFLPDVPFPGYPDPKPPLKKPSRPAVIFCWWCRAMCWGRAQTRQTAAAAWCPDYLGDQRSGSGNRASAGWSGTWSPRG